jgi:hypothetical protein
MGFLPFSPERLRPHAPAVTRRFIKSTITQNAARWGTFSDRCRFWGNDPVSEEP